MRPRRGPQRDAGCSERGIKRRSTVTSSRLVVRNSALNLVGQVAPLFIALLTIPSLIRGFGIERFGVLTLVQAAIGYFNLFEFGLGRALTQSVAQRLSNGKSAELSA